MGGSYCVSSPRFTHCEHGENIECCIEVYLAGTYTHPADEVVISVAEYGSFEDGPIFKSASFHDSQRAAVRVQKVKSFARFDREDVIVDMMVAGRTSANIDVVFDDASEDCLVLTGEPEIMKGDW